MNKQFIASLCVLAVVGMAVGVGVKGADIVDCTVTPKLIAVSVGDGSVDYGVLSFGNDTNDTLDGTAVETQTITNDSNVSADIDLKSTDATGTTPWELVSAMPGSEEFRHQYDIDGTAGFAVWEDFPTDNNYTITPVATLTKFGGADDSATLDLNIVMPSSSSDMSDHSITITARATESAS